MERNRNIKIITVIALVISLIGISLGFAAFSDILTISSSATVTPNAEDFKLTIYGISNQDVFNEANGGNIDFSMWSTTMSFPCPMQTPTTAGGKNAIINNDDFTVSNIEATFVEPGYDIMYGFAVKNDGEYDVYMSLDDLSFLGSKSCEAEEGTTQSLVNAACSAIEYSFSFMDDNGIFDGNNLFNSAHKIEKGGFAEIALNISYDANGSRADGDFKVTFPDVSFKFSTSPDISS